MAVSTFTPSPTYSGLALAAFFHGSGSAVDAVQADISYILTGPGQPGRVQQNGTPNMSILLNPFTCVLAGPSPGSSGPQIWTPGSAQQQIFLADPDLTNPRIDMLSVQITQNPDAPTQTPGMASLVVNTGQPAASPVEPVLPAGSLPLARIFVNAGAGAVITTGSITPRQSLGGLRGATVRGHPYAFGRVTRPGQFFWDEATGRLFLTDATSTLRSVPGIGTWPEWYLSGSPANFAIPTGVGTAAMGFSTAQKNVGIGLSSMTTGAIITIQEAGSYQMRASGTIAGSGNGNNRRMLLERRNSGGVKQERIQMEPFYNANIGPRFNASGRMRCNAGDTIFAAIFQDSGVSLAAVNTDLDWVFEGYKTADL